MFYHWRLYDLSNQDNEHVCNFIEMMLEGH